MDREPDVVDDGTEPAALDDEIELAAARLEWAKEARCLDIPEQARAVSWHVAACSEARAAGAADGGEQR